MTAVSIAKKVNQEKQLDKIQEMLRELLHQVDNNASSYNQRDRMALRKAYIALDAVTLVSDKELDEFWANLRLGSAK